MFNTDFTYSIWKVLCINDILIFVILNVMKTSHNINILSTLLQSNWFKWIELSTTIQINNISKEVYKRVFEIYSSHEWNNYIHKLIKLNFKTYSHVTGSWHISVLPMTTQSCTLSAPIYLYLHEPFTLISIRITVR